MKQACDCFGQGVDSSTATRAGRVNVAARVRYGAFASFFLLSSSIRVLWREDGVAPFEHLLRQWFARHGFWMLGLATIGNRKGRAVVDPTNELMSGFRHCNGYPVPFDPPHSIRVLGDEVLTASVVLKQQQKSRSGRMAMPDVCFSRVELMDV